MSSNLFGQPSKNDIKVGYVDPQLGYVSGVSICEANEYGKLNPGTTFVFKNGSNVLQYLTLNEVNKLTPTDLESNKKCEGINQKKLCGPPNIQIYGGGGIGAQANPVIGLDGSLLAVDVVRGGHGYEYAPQVSANDNCNYGSGSVLVSTIGETSEQFETYTEEDDFEEYELCDPDDVGFGRRYGPNGEDLGPWEPSSYTRIGGDPIKNEIAKYEKVIRDLARTPFWDTRKKRPNKISSSDPNRIIPSSVYNVTDVGFVDYQKKNGSTNPAGWSEYMNKYAISPVSPSSVRGSDYAAVLFTMEWYEDFPATGEYIFSGQCDNSAQLYIDNEIVLNLNSGVVLSNGVSAPIKPARKTISEGVHNIRVDLLNVPVEKTVIKSVEQDLVDVDFTVYGQGAFEDLSFSFISEDGKDSFTIPGVKKDKKARKDRINIRPNTTYKVIAKEDSSKYKSVEQGLIQKGKKDKEGGPGTSNKIFADYIGSQNDNDDIQITASSGTFTSLNKRRVKYSGRNTYDLTFKVNSTSQKNSQSSSSSSSSSSALNIKTVFNTLDYINKADRKLWRTNPLSGPNSDFMGKYGVSPFDTTTKEAKTDSFAGIHRIRWDNIKFPVDGNYNIDIMVDDNVKLYIGNSSSGGKINDGSGFKDEILITKVGFRSPGKSTGKTTESRFFKAGTYRLRAELEQISGKPLAKGNPMSLAINIDVVTTETKVISPKSWIENPMGVSVTIDAPKVEPLPPQEAVPPQEGRCPNNPIWTTRFPPTGSKWYPVNFPGPRKITETITTDSLTVTNEQKEVDFSVYGQGAFADLAFVFTAVDGSHTFTVYGVDKNKKTRKEKIRITPNLNYVVAAKEYSSKYNSVEQGLTVGGRKAKEIGAGESSNTIFADYTKTQNDNDDIQITVSSGTFTSSNKRRAKNSTRNTYDLTYRLNASPGTKNTVTTSSRTYDAPGWSKFMNRYAISPVKPLDTPGSDTSGITYSTYWNIDIPYDGFYGVRGTRDNRGRILIDNTEISKLDGFNVESPNLVKTFLRKGRHTITAEVYNQPVTTSKVINQKIFSTKDWQVSGTSKTTTTTTTSAIKPKFIQKGKSYFLEVAGSGSGKVSFVMDVNDAFYIAGLAAKEIIIPSDSGKVKFSRKSSLPKEETIKNSGTFTGGKTYGPIEIIGASAGVSPPKASDNKMSFYDAQGLDINIKLSIAGITNASSSSSSVSSSGSLAGGTSKDGVVYDGPALFHYNDVRWGDYMNSYSVSPFLPPLDTSNAKINGVKKYTWKSVKFPESGQYKIRFQADNIGTLYINGVKSLTTTDFVGVPQYSEVSVGSGTYDIVVEVDNVKDNTDVFLNNPCGFALEITKDITLTSQNETPWSSNPMGISAILIPPPCPKKISGRGVVTKIDVIDPGNGYLPPSGSGSYPVSLVLESVLITDPGINYSCGEDKIQITPSNGSVLDYVCDPFGKIKEVKVLNPGFGFTEYPNITIPSETGVNASFRPQFRVVRDPIAAPEKIIQVTDLVGLKQNGYIEGRAYYGAVFYKEGVRYAGFYETPGKLVQVYDTLQESVDAQVVTRASAIQRSGTDTELSSNNPKLNIPNTPENLI
jgi:hypothetical protein